MSTAVSRIDQQLAQQRKAARNAYIRHVLALARGGGHTAPDLEIAKRAGVTPEDFRAEVDLEAKRWGIIKRLRKLEDEVASTLRPTLDEAVDGPYGIEPRGKDRNGNVSMVAKKKFEEFIERREAHEQRKPAMREEIAELRKQLESLRSLYA
jgi:hypothetical protein